MSKKVMVLMSIVEQGKGKKLIKALNSHRIKVNFQSVGLGTAPTEMMDIFGLGSIDKDIIISLGAENDVRNLLTNISEALQSNTKYGGLMIVFDVLAANRILCEILNFGSNQNTEAEAVNMQNEHQNNLIIISVNEGYSDSVMQTARKAGAMGGTVIKGRLADVDQFAEYIDTKGTAERELLCILAHSKVCKQIMEDVNREFGLTSSANGIVFALPTEKAMKI